MFYKPYIFHLGIMTSDFLPFRRIFAKQHPDKNVKGRANFDVCIWFLILYITEGVVALIRYRYVCVGWRRRWDAVVLFNCLCMTLSREGKKKQQTTDAERRNWIPNGVSFSFFFLFKPKYIYIYKGKQKKKKAWIVPKW